VNVEIGVRTADGAIVRIFADRATTFTTSVDDQRAAVFEIYTRRRPNDPWQPLREVSLEPLPPSPAGRPDLEVRILRARGGTFALEVVDSFARVARSVPLPGVERRRRRAAAAAAVAAAAILACIAGVLLHAPGQQPQPTAASRSLPQPAPAAPAVREPPPQPAPQPPAPQQQAAAAPPAPQAPPAAPADAEYRIVWGDTLVKIAEKHYGDRFLYADLAARNGLADPDLIIAGETLRLPKSLGR
jgi:nucleoid-associated protein YgaU